jgi:hypothetical protein
MKTINPSSFRFKKRGWMYGGSVEVLRGSKRELLSVHRLIVFIVFSPDRKDDD